MTVRTMTDAQAIALCEATAVDIDIYFNDDAEVHGRAIEANLAKVGLTVVPTGLRTAALYALADLRTLAEEAGETDPATSPALRAAQRLAAVLYATEPTVAPAYPDDPLGPSEAMATYQREGR